MLQLDTRKERRPSKRHKIIVELNTCYSAASSSTTDFPQKTPLALCYFTVHGVLDVMLGLLGVVNSRAANTYDVYPQTDLLMVLAFAGWQDSHWQGHPQFAFGFATGS